MTSIQIHSKGQEQALMKVKEVFTEYVVRHLEEDVRGYYGVDGEEIGQESGVGF